VGLPKKATTYVKLDFVKNNNYLRHLFLCTELIP
jgi:hypothetical protein